MTLTAEEPAGMTAFAFENAPLGDVVANDTGVSAATVCGTPAVWIWTVTGIDVPAVNVAAGDEIARPGADQAENPHQTEGNAPPSSGVAHPPRAHAAAGETVLSRVP